MPKRNILTVKLYRGAGNFATVEFQVCFYITLTSPSSRSRICKGGIEGEKVARPLEHKISSGDVLEFMPRTEDIRRITDKLQQAESLRNLRAELREQGKTEEEIIKELDQRIEQFNSEG